MLKNDGGLDGTVQHQLPIVSLETLQNDLNPWTPGLGDSQNTLDIAQTLGRIAKRYFYSTSSKFVTYTCPVTQLSRADAGVLSREMGISFRDLQVIGLGAASSYQDTVGSIFNPFNIIKQVQAQRHPATRHIISGFEGTVAPGEMLR